MATGTVECVVKVLERSVSGSEENNQFVLLLPAGVEDMKKVGRRISDRSLAESTDLDAPITLFDDQFLPFWIDDNVP